MGLYFLVAFLGAFFGSLSACALVQGLIVLDDRRRRARVDASVAKQYATPTPHPADVRRRELRAAATLRPAGRLPVVLLAIGLSLYGAAAVAGCATNRALMTSTPTAAQVAAVHDEAIKIASGATTALKLTSIALTAADEAQKAKLVSAAFLKELATVCHDFSVAASKGLDELALVATEPSLRQTATTLLDALRPVTAKLSSSTEKALQVLGTSIDVAVDALRLFLVHGDPAE